MRLLVAQSSTVVRFQRGENLRAWWRPSSSGKIPWLESNRYRPNSSSCSVLARIESFSAKRVEHVAGRGDRFDIPHNRHIAGDALVLLARDWASNTSLNLPMVLCGCVEDHSNVVSIAFVCPYRLCHIANILVVSIEALNNKRAALGVLLRGAPCRLPSRL